MRFELTNGEIVEFPNLESVHPVGKKGFSNDDLLTPCVIEVVYDGGIVEHYRSEDIDSIFF